MAMKLQPFRSISDLTPQLKLMRILWCLLGACAYPLAPPETSEKCLCPQHEGSGWSSEQNRCLSSSVTSCLECPSQLLGP